MDKEMDVERKKVSGEPSASQISVARVGRENISDSIAPHETYEGRHRYDPGATWTEQEERKVVWKTDIYLLTWICVMVWYPNIESENQLTKAIKVLWAAIRQREPLECSSRQLAEGLAPN
jgi:hypothetical protein